MTALLAILVIVVLLNLLVAAALLWLACKLLRLRWPARDGSPEQSVGYARALGVTLASYLVGWLLLAGALTLTLTGHIDSSDVAMVALVLGLPLVSLVLGWLVVYLLLPASLPRSLGVYIIWELLQIGQAVVLVLGLRAALFEAFVVPTGAMAETVYGYQKLVGCPECGLEFPLNCSVEADPGGGPPIHVSNCTCPNCRQAIQLVPPVQPDGSPTKATSLPPGSTIDPGCNSGDRILAGKGLLGVGTLVPARFDLIVFDFPGEPGQPPPPRPVRYVKRLVGLPGEMIAIHRGKLFLLPAEQVPERSAPREEDSPQRVQTDPDGPKLFEQGKFQVLRKTPPQVLALRRLVHDNDHQAKDLSEPEYQRWVGAADSGWSAAGKTAFRHEEGADLGWLRYRHVLRESGGKAQLITDFMGYNTGPPNPVLGKNWATDLIVECTVQVEKAAGVFALELSRGPDRFQARFDLKTGDCALQRLSGKAEPVVLKSAPTRLHGKGSYQVRFANVDERLTVWVDGRLPFAAGVEYEGPRKLLPVKENDLDRPASVGARGTTVTVKRLRLFRDTYYTARGDNPSSEDVPQLDPADPDTWKHVEDAPFSAYRVEPDHYFVLGDNSQASSDSRSWGNVPAKNLLGKVLLRYYPLARWGRVD
jgi:signal peptidase I